MFLRRTALMRLILLLILVSLVLTGCSLDLPKRIQGLTGKDHTADDLVKVFGPVAQRLAAGEGWVVLSPTAGGAQEIGYLTPGQHGWQLQGRHRLDGGATVTVEQEMVIAKALREEAPQFTAFRYGAAGLTPVDYYTQKAPEATVQRGHYVLVNKQLNVLWHYLDGQLIKAYRVATGRQTAPPAPTWSDYKTNFFTPEGIFALTNFVENPPYNALKPGDVSYPGGAPGNPLGTRWMGFVVLENDKAWVWGIHGTNAPDRIGTWASDGCIRMYTPDAEELFAVLKGRNAVLQIVGQ